MEKLINHVKSSGGDVKKFDQDRRIAIGMNKTYISLKEDCSLEIIQQVFKIFENPKKEFEKMIADWGYDYKIDFAGNTEYLHDFESKPNSICFMYQFNNKWKMIFFNPIKPIWAGNQFNEDCEKLKTANEIIKKIHWWQLSINLPPDIIRIIFKYSLVGTAFE